jgi:hypothetical protein
MPQGLPLYRPGLIFAAALMVGGIALRGLPSAAESAHAISPPAHDEPANAAASGASKAYSSMSRASPG